VVIDELLFSVAAVVFRSRTLVIVRVAVPSMVSVLFVKVELAAVMVVLPVKDTVLFVGSKLLSDCIELAPLALKVLPLIVMVAALSLADPLMIIMLLVIGIALLNCRRLVMLVPSITIVLPF